MNPFGRTPCGAGSPSQFGLMLWIAYQSDVQDEATRVQKQIKAQHDEFVMRRHLWDKSQEITAALSRTDVGQSQPSISKIQGPLNHVDTLREQPKRQKKSKGPNHERASTHIAGETCDDDVC